MAEISSSVPPPTWNDASEMPKNSMIFCPASALRAMTRNALKALTRIVRRRCSRDRFWVKWMKKGTTPIGLTIASSAISGLSRSMHRFCGNRSSGERAQVAQAGDGARPVPADQFAVDDAHPRVRAQRTRKRDVLLAEGIGLAAEQHLVHVREPGLVAVQRRIARGTALAAGERRQRVPVHLRQHAR